MQLINQRAQCAREIGKLKRDSAMPVYEPDRERIIFREHRADANQGRCQTCNCVRSMSD